MSHRHPGSVCPHRRGWRWLEDREALEQCGWTRPRTLPTGRLRAAADIPVAPHEMAGAGRGGVGDVDDAALVSSPGQCPGAHEAVGSKAARRPLAPRGPPSGRTRVGRAGGQAVTSGRLRCSAVGRALQSEVHCRLRCGARAGRSGCAAPGWTGAGRLRVPGGLGARRSGCEAAGVRAGAPRVRARTSRTTWRGGRPGARPGLMTSRSPSGRERPPGLMAGTAHVSLRRASRRQVSPPGRSGRGER
jgi:hypothetical protein